MYRRTEVLHGVPVWNVSTRRKGPRSETRRRDLLGRDRDETETLSTLSETRPRRDVSTSRDGLETETSRPRPHAINEWTNVTRVSLRNEEIDPRPSESHAMTQTLQSINIIKNVTKWVIRPLFTPHPRSYLFLCSCSSWLFILIFIRFSEIYVGPTVFLHKIAI